MKIARRLALLMMHAEEGKECLVVSGEDLIH